MVESLITLSIFSVGCSTITVTSSFLHEKRERPVKRHRIILFMTMGAIRCFRGLHAKVFSYGLFCNFGYKCAVFVNIREDFMNKCVMNPIKWPLLERDSFS